MTAGYCRGYSGLANYLGVSAKSARSLDRRVKLPRILLPGVQRDVLLFKLSEIDEALSRFRADAPVPKPTIDINMLVEEIVGRRAG